MSTKYIASNWRLPNQENSSKSDNYGLTFDGSNEFIDCDSGVSMVFIPTSEPKPSSNGNHLLAISPKSYSCWFKVNTTGLKTIFSSAPTGGGYHVKLDVNSSDLLEFGLRTPSPTYTLTTGTTTIAIDTWYHVLITVDGANNKLYVNGTLEGTTACSGNMIFFKNSSSSNPKNLIGGHWVTSSTQDFNGSISEVAIFDYALSETQRNTLYGSSSLGAGNPMALKPQPVAYYPLGDNSASNPLTQPNEAVEDASVFQFDISSVEYVKIDGPALNFTDKMSFSGWGKFTSSAVGVYTVAANFDPNTGYKFAIYYYRDNNPSSSYFRVRINSANNTLQSYTVNGQLDVDRWYHLAFSFDGTTNADGVNLYIDNVKHSFTASDTGIYPNTANGTRIGNYQNNNTWAMIGEISNVQFWDTDLQDSDIATLYNNGQPLMTGTQPQAANLEAWYKLDQSANWEADSSGDWQIPDAVSAYPQSFSFAQNKIIRTPNNVFDGIVTGSNKIGICTISYWFKNNNTGVLQDYMSLNDAGTGLGNSAYFRIDSNNKILYHNGSNYVRWFAPSDIDGWNHYCWVFNSDTSYTTLAGQTNGDLEFYLNGEIKAVDFNFSATPSGDPWNGFNIAEAGQLSDASLDFCMSNLQLFDTNFSDSQVLQLYNNGTPLTTAIASDNLKGWYKLDNTATFLTNWVVENSAITPNFNKAIDFVSSSTQYIDLTNTGFPTGNASRTMSAWIKSDSTGQNNEQGILRYGTKATRQLFMMSLAASSGQLRVSTYADDLTYSTADLRDDAWHHVALTYDGTSIKGYVDGSYVGLETNTLVNTTANSPAIGNWNDAGFTFNGAISNVLLYTETLTDANILTLYNNGTPQTTPYGSPFGWWKLDDLATGIQDSGSGGNNGTLVNSPLLISTDVKAGSGISSGMTEQNLVNNNVSALNGESSGMTSANLVLSDLTRAVPYGDGYSFNFDAASSDYINIYNGTVGSLPSQFSIGASDSASFSFWIKSNTTGSSKFFYTQRGSAPYLRFYISYHSPSDSYRTTFAVRDDSSVEVFDVSDATNIVNRNQWNHIAGIIDRSASKLYVYVNGVVTGTGASLGSLGAITQVTDVAIGGDPFPSGSIRFEFDGKISNCSIFNEALTSTEVMKLYANGVPQDLTNFTPAPVAWWPLGSNSFWNGSAWTVRDMSTGGSNDGTGQNIGIDGLVGDSPRSEANGTGTNIDIPTNLEGSTKWSSNNSWSINMSETARVEDTP